MRELRDKLPPKFPGSTMYFQNADIVTQVLNFGLPAPIDVQIQDANFERAQRYAARVRKIIEETPGAVDVRQMQVLNYPALRVEVDRVRAARLGLTQRDVASNVLTTLSSSAIVNPSYFLNPNGVNYTVAVQTPIERMSSVEDLMATPITSGATPVLDNTAAARMDAVPGAPVTRLSNIASIRPETSYQSVSHYTVQRVLDIAANVDGRDLGGVVSDIKRKIDAMTAEKDFPPTSKITIRGQYQVMNASFESLIGGLLLAIVLVYALLVVLFQSWIDPFIIMMAVPGALIGILWILALSGTTINVMSLMGAIMAVGIGVSNSILIVSFANDLRVEKNLGVIEAAIEAGRTRLRPVLMTALAMIIGMVPMALGLGEAGEQNAPLGRAVIGGLTMATIATLFVVPVIYTFVRKKHADPARPRCPLRGRGAGTPSLRSDENGCDAATTRFVRGFLHCCLRTGGRGECCRVVVLAGKADPSRRGGQGTHGAARCRSHRGHRPVCAWSRRPQDQSDRRTAPLQGDHPLFESRRLSVENHGGCRRPRARGPAHCRSPGARTRVGIQEHGIGDGKP